MNSTSARFDDPVVGQAQAWFERLWEEAVPVDLTELFEEVFAEWTPFDIFLRTLYELYGHEVAEDERADKGLPLTNFQKHGAVRAMRLIRENGGAIVADEVGLGKTFIAGGILRHYLDNRHRCLLICPAQLLTRHGGNSGVRTTWATLNASPMRNWPSIGRSA